MRARSLLLPSLLALAGCAGSTPTSSLPDGAVLPVERASFQCVHGGGSATLVIEADGRVFVNGTQTGRIEADGTALDEAGGQVGTVSESGEIRALGDLGRTTRAQLSEDRRRVSIEGGPRLEVRDDGVLLLDGEVSERCRITSGIEARETLLYLLVLVEATSIGDDAQARERTRARDEEARRLEREREALEAAEAEMGAEGDGATPAE